MESCSTKELNIMNKEDLVKHFSHYEDILIVRCWGEGVTEPLFIMVNEEDHIDFTKDPESINAEVILHRDDLRKVANFLNKQADYLEKYYGKSET